MSKLLILILIKILHFPYSRLSFHLLQGFPNDRDNERFEQELGVRISGFPGSHVADGSIDVIKHEFVEDSKLTKRSGSTFGGIIG